MANTVIWANIPVDDMARAKRFYGEFLGLEMEGIEGYGEGVAVPVGSMQGEGVAFNLIASDEVKPCPDGVRIVFPANGDMQGMLARAEAAGGKVVRPAAQMGPIGTFAQVMDSEGNIVSVME